jgi:head-tail adaptor
MASLLSATDLAAMKATQALALPSTCTIERRSLVADTLGGYTETWATLASGVACRLSAMSAPSEVVVAERWAGRAMYQLTVPAGQDVTADDRVVVGSVTYEVAGLNSAGAWETARRVIVARVT